MTYLSLSKFSHFDNPKVIAKIRRSIASLMVGGECVCVLDDGVLGLDDTARAEIERGWPTTKVKFSSTHPNAKNAPTKKERRPRRRL